MRTVDRNAAAESLGTQKEQRCIESDKNDTFDPQNLESWKDNTNLLERQHKSVLD